MLKASVDSGKYQEAMNRAVDYVQNLGFENIRARHEDYDEPAKLVMQGQDKTFIPDITAMKNGGKYYFDVWAEAPQAPIKKATISQQRIKSPSSDMDVDAIKKSQQNNSFWILGTSDELEQQEGFKRQEH